MSCGRAVPPPLTTKHTLQAPLLPCTTSQAFALKQFVTSLSINAGPACHRSSTVPILLAVHVPHP